MIEKHCMGCGALLQTNDPDSNGYAKSLDHTFCQSCFRLRHYRDFKHVRSEVNTDKTLEFIENFEGHIFWIVDVMQLNQSLHSGLIRALSKKDVVLVVNKRDLLPQAVYDEKLKRNILSLLKDYKITLMDVVFVSANKRMTLKPLWPYLEDASVAFVGCINAGKSSLLNTLLGEDVLSVSPVSNTTAEIIRIETEDFEVYDTPGFIKESKIHEKLNDETLTQLAPTKTIKPTVIQIYEPQTIMLGNLGYIEIIPEAQLNFISYLPFEVKRVKPDRADANLNIKHSFMIDNPVYKTKYWPKVHERVDLEIFDIGFVSIQGEYKQLKTVMDENAELILRKAII